MRGTRLGVALLMLLVPLAHAEPTSDEPDAGSEAGAAPAAAEAGSDDTAQLLTLREAIRLALQNNLRIESARYEPLIADSRVDAAVGAYDPLIFGSYKHNHEETPVASSFLNAIAGGPVTSVQNENWIWDGGLQGVLPAGLEYSSTFESRNLQTDSPSSTLDPEYNSTWVTLVTLPLLRDLVTNDLSIAVSRTRTDAERSLADFQTELTDLIVAVELLYWDLDAKVADTRVARKSLQTATELLEQTRVQYEVGVVSRVEVVQAEAGVAQREFDLIVAENREAKAHDDLLNAVFAPNERVFEERQIKVEKAVFRDYDVDVQVAVSKALELRPELAAARSSVEDANLQLTLAENKLLPTVDLVGRYAWTGQAGRVTDFARAADPTLPGLVDRSRSDTLDDWFSASGQNSYTIGGEFSIPFGNQTAKAVRTQRSIELRRSTTFLRRVEQQVILSVRDAVRTLRSSIEGIQAAERNRVAQAETLDAEQERLRLGDSTPFQVLQHEEDLAAAERQLITSLQAHRTAIATLDRAQGTLLDRLNISIEEELHR